GRWGGVGGLGAIGGSVVRAGREGGFALAGGGGLAPGQPLSAQTSDVLVTEMTNATLGLKVTATNFILPDRDVLVNSYVVERERGSPVQSARFVFYANFSPTLTRTAFSPVNDWALDFENDFAVVYDRREGALLHFLPVSAAAFPHDFSLLNPLLAAPPRTRRALQRAVDRLVGGLTEPGVYLALGAAPRDDGYQAGFDDAPICAHQSAFVEQLASQLGPDSADLARGGLACNGLVGDPAGPLGACRSANGWIYRAENAFTDATDGTLARSPVAACQANAALVQRLRFRRGMARATFYVVVGGTRDEVYGVLRAVRAGRVDQQQAATESWWSDFLRPAHLPDTDDPSIRGFARRALIATRTATDNASGA